MEKKGLLISLIVCSSMAYTQQVPPLPETLEGWILTGKKEITSHDALYDHIDGGAELYISYGFRSALSCRYACPGEPDVQVELFDLGSAADAWGVYSQTRDQDQQEFGQGSYAISGALFFWKNNFWISLVTNEVTARSEAFMRVLATRIDQGIPDTGAKPSILSLLPEEGLVPGGSLYFHHYIWLNAFVYIASENILMLDSQTPAVLAKYNNPEERLHVLIIQYPEPAKAENAYNRFRREYLPGGMPDPCMQLTDGTWMAIERRENVVAGVFNGINRELVLKKMDQVREKLVGGFDK